jgi:hypothetical protein
LRYPASCVSGDPITTDDHRVVGAHCFASVGQTLIDTEARTTAGAAVLA